MTIDRHRPLALLQLLSVAVALAAAIAVAVALAIVVPPAARQAQPDIPVRAYLQALTKGDVPAALKLGRITPAAGDRLLTTAAYATASDRITSFTITSVRVEGDTAIVGARVRQGGTGYTATFATERESGFPGLTPWRLAAQQLPQLDIAVTGPSGLPVTVAGVTLTTKADAMSQRVLPGTYVVAAAPNPDYTVASQTVRATFTAAAHPAQLTVALTAAGKAKAQESASAWIAKCAASTDLVPSGCPFHSAVEPGITVLDGHWTVSAQPTLAFGTWSTAVGGWVVTSETPGTVTYTGRATRGGRLGTASTGAFSFFVVGAVVPSGSGVSFVPSPGYSSESGQAAA